jgi:hypothetical protein
MGTYLLIEAGPDMRCPAPARRRAFSLWSLRMKLLILVGVLAAVFGAYVLTRDSLGSRRSVVKVGGFEASVQEQSEIPKWAGIVSLAGGALLIGAGLRGRKS